VGGAEGLLLWIEGLASPTMIQMGVLEPLSRLCMAGRPSRAAISVQVTVPGQSAVTEIAAVLERVLAGHTALLVDGWAEALLLDTSALPSHHTGSPSPSDADDIFGRDFLFNLALIRKRLRDPHLVARWVVPARPRPGLMALVYMEGRADPALVRRVRMWARLHAGEEMAGRGMLTATGAVFGLAPRFDLERWPDKVAILLETGHVGLMLDRMMHVYIAPVTMATAFLAPNDFGVGMSIHRWIARVRLAIYVFVLIAPGSVVAIGNYHQEMLPTSFLMAIASARENAPYGVFFEVLVLEVLIEIAREAAFRLPAGVPRGFATITVTLVVLMAVQAGLTGPVPALTAVMGGLVSLALPSLTGIQVVRAWRFYVLLGALFFGFFGIAAVFTGLLTYLCQTHTWGPPMLGPSGWDLTSAETPATRVPQRRRSQSGRA
jgi:hypothetical protein